MFHFIFPSLNCNIEHWKWNKEYHIYVSNLGRFKDEHKNLLDSKINNKGYIMINTLYGYKTAHRLVLITWRPVKNMDILTVDHLNHNKRDNSLNNLEWISGKENKKRAANDMVSCSPFSPHVESSNAISQRIIINIPVIPTGKVYCRNRDKMFNTIKEASVWLKNNGNTSVKKDPTITIPDIEKKLAGIKHFSNDYTFGRRAFGFTWYFG